VTFQWFEFSDIHLSRGLLNWGRSGELIAVDISWLVVAIKEELGMNDACAHGDELQTVIEVTLRRLKCLCIMFEVSD
jgi:hypothetical protein